MRVLLLGSLTVVHGREEILIKGKLQQVLLARLALAETTPVTTHSLIEDLWGDTPPRNPQHALQAQVSCLRAVLPVELERINDAYRLATASTVTDAAAFVALSETARTSLELEDWDAAVQGYDRALELWRGPMATHFADVPGLRQFVLGLEETRRRTRADRIDAYICGGRSEEVIAELRATLETDSLHERSWGQLMRALREAGRPQEALAAFRHAREMFVNELGTEPAESLVRLHAEILVGGNGTITPWTEATVRSQVVASSTLRDPPDHLVGRRREWTMLHRALEQRAPGLRMVTLSGEPGIGKSKLARSFVQEVRDAGVMVLEGHCSSTDQRPYEPFADMLHRFLEHYPGIVHDERMQPHMLGLARVLPEFAVEFGVPEAHAPDVQAPPDYRALGAMVAWLDAVSCDEHLVIFIEDVHLADAETLVLVQHLIRRREGMNALFVVTTRDAQLPILDAVTQSDVVTHVPLRPLEAAEVRSLIADEVAQCASTLLPEWMSEYVASVSGGNPLFVVELTRHLVATGAQSMPVEVPVPLGLQQVILARLSALPQTAQTVLTRVAVVGAAFDAHLAAAITGQPLQVVDEALQEAVRARMVEPVDGRARRLRLSHDIVRAVLADAVPPTERAQLHRAIAHTLESRGGNLASHFALLAHHHQLTDDAEGRREAVRYLLLAGREALQCDAPADAVAHFTDAVELLRDERCAADRCDALIELGRAQLQAANPRYRATLLEAARIAIGLQDARRLSEAVLENSRGWWSSAIRVDYERLETIETAIAWCDEGDTRTSALLLGNWAVESVRDPAARDAVLARSEKGLRLAEATGGASVLASALMQRYTVLSALIEHVDECLSVNERLLTISQTLGDRSLRLSASIGLAQTLMRTGELSLADQYLVQATQLARALNHPPRTWLVLGWQAMRELMRGCIDSAEALIQETYAYGQRTDQDDAFTWFAGQLFTLRMMQGRLPEMLGELREHVPTVADGIPAWRAAMAFACAEAGETGTAHDLVNGLVVDGFVRLPKDMLWLHGLTYLARACELLGRADDASVLIKKLEPYAGMIATNGTIDAGPIDLTLGILACARGETRAARARFEAAESLARRIDASLWLGEAQERLDALPPAS